MSENLKFPKVVNQSFECECVFPAPRQIRHIIFGCEASATAITGCIEGHHHVDYSQSLDKKMIFSLMFLLLSAVPSICLDCWKCADNQVQRWKPYVWEINLSVSKWPTCDNPEVIWCNFGCYEARLTVFSEGPGPGYLRACANDRVIKQIKWNGTSALPERKDNLAMVQGRMCTSPKCNKHFKATDEQLWLVSFFTAHATAIATICIIGVFSIPALIFGVRYAYSKLKVKRSGYQTPSEDAAPMTFSDV